LKDEKLLEALITTMLNAARISTAGDPPVVERAAIFAMTAMLAGLAASAAVACALAALWIYGEPYLGPAGAALMIAFVLAIICLVAVIFHRRSERSLAPPPEAISPADLLIPALAAFKENKVTFIAAAVIAGIVFDIHRGRSR
jgi:fatty acid desaturase